MRYSIPPTNPPVNRAAELHRDGFSCKTVAAYRYDANGHKRWCIDCGAELGERSWDPDGAEVSNRWLGGLLAAAALIIFSIAVLLAVVLPFGPGSSAPVQIPTTYGPPSTVVSSSHAQ